MRRNIISVTIILIAVLIMLGGFIWYGESGSNKETPKRAKLVYEFTIRGDDYR